MPSQDRRITRLEETVEKHLIESGTIQANLKANTDALEKLKDVPADVQWLKNAIYFVIGSPVLMEVVRYVLSRKAGN